MAGNSSKPVNSISTNSNSIPASNESHNMTSSPDQNNTQSLPSLGGFRLQPRKSISLKATPPPRKFSSCSSRGRKRGAQTMVSTLQSGSSLAAPKALLPSVSSAAFDTNDGMTFPSPCYHGGCPDSPGSGSVHRAIQSMCIKSPGFSTPSSQQTIFRDRDTTSPFIVFSPSLKPCPYNSQNTRAESFCSMDSSTKAPTSMLNTPGMTPTYESPCRKPFGSNNTELLSTPRLHSLTPKTPLSRRTLPSPHATPLPRSLRLTPRSRRHQDCLSNDSSIFLSPSDEKLDPVSPRNEASLVFSFQEGVRSLQPRNSYVPSPYSCSRSSVASGRALHFERKSSVGEGGKDTGGASLRVETRSLLGPQDSNSVSDIMSAANARSVALDCDKSLTDDEGGGEHFVLANPLLLAQERDEMRMPPPRPNRRRRMSSADSDSKSNAQSSEVDDESGEDTTRNTNPSLQPTVVSSQVGHQPIAKDDPRMNSSSVNREVLVHHQPIAEMISPGTSPGQLRPIESSCSLMGLGLADSSATIDDGNERPQTPPTTLNEYGNSLPQTPSSRSSVSSVRISRSDANNVHRTIASMAAVHQQMYSPLMTCNS
eukprot:jgi/Psemu1/282049/fgenesh1_pg.2_\